VKYLAFTLRTERGGGRMLVRPSLDFSPSRFPSPATRLKHQWNFRGVGPKRKSFRPHGPPICTIVYLALEGSFGFARRVEAWRQRHKPPDDAPFYLLDVSIDLIADHKALISAIHDQIRGAPAVIVIDTLNRALMGDENKSDDMAKFIRAADTVRTAFNCLMLLIHHCGIAGNRPRGHTSLAGADDVQIAIEKDKDGIC
jgi:hypothetical protein